MKQISLLKLLIIPAISAIMTIMSVQTPVFIEGNATQQAGNGTQQANQTFDPTANLSSIPTSPNEPEVTPGS